jgi:hypothetical protein
MPYKDPERKRQWEREHRQQRNARRNLQRQPAWSGQPNVPRPAPHPASDQEPKTTWKTILGFAVGIGVVLLAAFASVDLPTPGDLGTSSGSGGPGM